MPALLCVAPLPPVRARGEHGTLLRPRAPVEPLDVNSTSCADGWRSGWRWCASWLSIQPAQSVARTATRAAGAARHHAADNNAPPKAQGGRDQATMAMNIADEEMKTLVAWLPLGPA